MAYLVAATYAGGRRGHLMAFVDTLPGAEPSLARAVGDALTFSGVEAGSLDVGFFRASDPVAARLARVGLRFDLPEAPKADRVPGSAPGMDPDAPPRAALKGAAPRVRAPLAPSLRRWGRVAAAGPHGPADVPFAAARRLRRAYLGNEKWDSRARSVAEAAVDEPHEGVTCLAAQDVGHDAAARPIRAAWPRRCAV